MRTAAELAKLAELDAELFTQFRARDADGGVVRSYAHNWCDASAIAWAIEALERDPATRVVLVIADHHRSGDTCYLRFALYREADDIRCSLQGCRVAMLDYGIAHATADLAYALGRHAKTCDAMVFRQPPKE